MSKCAKYGSVVAAAAMACLVTTGAFAQDVVRLDLANENPASSLPAQSELRFIQLVEEKTDGSVIITPHFGGALGYDSRGQFTAVRDGAVGLASSPFDKYVGLAPIFALQSLPFLTPTIDQTQTLFEVARPYYEEAFNKANQTLLLGEPWTPQGIWAKSPIESVEDLKSLKIRSYDATGTRTLARAGAAPVQLASSDVVPGLSTNMIVGVLTSDESGVNGRYWEHGVNYFNFLGYTMGISAVTMNLDVFNSLTEEQQTAIRAAAAQAEEEAWQTARSRVDHNKAIMAENDAVYVDNVPQEVIDHLKEAGSPELDAWKEAMGPAADEILAEFESNAK